MGFGISFGIGPFRIWASPRRRRRAATTWTHPGCTIQHPTQAAANQHATQLRVNAAKVNTSHSSLLAQAAELVIVTQHASAGLIMRKLRVGIAVSGQLMDLLVQHGILAPAAPGQPHKLLAMPADLSRVLAALPTDDPAVTDLEAAAARAQAARAEAQRIGRLQQHHERQRRTALDVLSALATEAAENRQAATVSQITRVRRRIAAMSPAEYAADPRAPFRAEGVEPPDLGAAGS